MMENQGKKRGFIIIGVLIFIIILIIAFFLGGGFSGIISIFQYLFFFILIVGVIGLIVYAIFWLFQKHPIDAINVHRKKIISSCRMNRTPFKQSLAFSGDDEFSHRIIGKIVGFCELKSPPIKEVTEKKIDDKIPFKRKVVTPITEWENFVFIAFRKNILGNINICGVKKKDLIGINKPLVLILASNFAPEYYKIFFPSKYFSYSAYTDEIAKEGIYKLGMEETLRDHVNIVEDAIHIDPRFKKDEAKTNIQQLQSEMPKKNP